MLHLIGLRFKYFTQHNQKSTFLIFTPISSFWFLSGFHVILWDGHIAISSDQFQNVNKKEWKWEIQYKMSRLIRIVQSDSEIHKVCHHRSQESRNLCEMRFKIIISVKWPEKSTELRCFWQQYRSPINYQSSMFTFCNIRERSQKLMLLWMVSISYFRGDQDNASWCLPKWWSRYIRDQDMW
jgi:hypothetical protein